MSALDPSKMTPEELEAWASEGAAEPELTAVAPPAPAPEAMSPDELEAWATAAPAAPAAPEPVAPSGLAPGMVTLVDANGVRSDVPEYQMLNAIAEGKKPLEEYEADQREAALQAEYGGAGSALLTGAEGASRGLTLGASDVAGAALTGALTPEGPKLTPEYQAKVEAYNKAHPDAPLQGNGKSSFEIGYEAARAEQQNRKAASPGIALGTELAGAVAPALVSGGTSALAYTPAALAERAGAGVLAKTLGAGGAAGASVLRKGAAGLLGGATEGAIAGGALAASEVAPEIITDPGMAAEHILTAISEGGLIGGIFGGVLHTVSGALSKGARKLDEVGDNLAPVVKVEAPPVHADNMDEIVFNLEAKPAGTSLDEIAANDQRGKYAKLVEQERAASGLFYDTVQKESRAIRSEFDDILRAQNQIDEHAGIAAKKRANTFNEAPAASPLDAQSGAVMFPKSAQLADATDEVLGRLVGEIDGFAAGRSKQGLASGGGLAAIEGLKKEIKQTGDLMRSAYGQGKIGDAYHLFDQGIKSFIGKARNSVRTAGVQDLMERLYKLPQEFLEDDHVWGDLVDEAGGLSLSQRQRLANPAWSNRISQSQDAAVKQFTSIAGERAANGWDNARLAEPGAIKSLLEQLGDAGTASRAEEAFRTNLRAYARDAVDRSKAWGSERLQAEAQKIVANVAKIEKRLDDVAAVRADALQGERAAQASSTADLLASSVGVISPRAAFAITGSASARRKVIAAVAEAGSAVGSQTAKSAAKLVRLVQSGAQTAARVAPRAAAAAVGAAAAAPLLSQKKYDAAINEAQALSDPRSPETRALLQQAADLEQHEPELADAFVTQQVQRAAYIQALLPKQLSGAMFARNPIMDPQRARRVAAQVSAAYYPERTLRRLADGSATVEEVKTIKALFPQVYQGFVDQVQDELSRQKGPPSREGAQRLHQLTGIAVTPEQEPKNIARQQAQFAQQSDAQRMGQAPTQQAQQALKPIKISTDRDGYATRGDRLATGA